MACVDATLRADFLTVVCMSLRFDLDLDTTRNLRDPLGLESLWVNRNLEKNGGFETLWVILLDKYLIRTFNHGFKSTIGGMPPMLAMAVPSRYRPDHCLHLIATS